MGDQFHVNSHNQSGGITAGQVNIGSFPPLFDASAKRLVEELLEPHREKDITVGWLAGHQECYPVAVEIHKYLRSRGWKVKDRLSQGHFPRPIQGIQLWPRVQDTSEPTIVVGPM